MAKRRLSPSKKRHEISRFVQERLRLIHNYASIIKRIDPLTIDISPDGIGSIYTPSLEYFSRVTPQSPPTGIVFLDSSFLAFREIVSYGYSTESSSDPEVYCLEYSYHYQRPQDNAFFRYDFHPGIGDPETHPLHHLHAAGWPNGATDLPSAPRFPVPEITLSEILDLIKTNFFS